MLFRSSREVALEPPSVFYAFDLPIPASTTKASPVKVEADLSPGIIHRVEVEFPAGCAGLVYVAIRRGIHQVWPGNPDGAFRSDNFVIAWDEHYADLEKPYLLDLVGWNLDDTYPHTPIVRIGILPAEIAEAPQQSAGLLQRLLRRMGV